MPKLLTPSAVPPPPVNESTKLCKHEQRKHSEATRRGRGSTARQRAIARRASNERQVREAFSKWGVEPPTGYGM